jgi:hypothetical protein
MPYNAQGGRRERGIGGLDYLSVEDLTLLAENCVHDDGLDHATVSRWRAHECRKPERANHDRSRPVGKHFLRRDELVGIVVGVLDVFEMNLQHASAAFDDGSLPWEAVPSQLAVAMRMSEGAKLPTIGQKTELRTIWMRSGMWPRGLSS